MITSRLSTPARWLVGVTAVAASAILLIEIGGRGRTATADDHAHHAMPMTDADMKAAIEAHYAAHPQVGPVATGETTAVFTVQNFRFDIDGSAATQIDTARIEVGESVLWQWVNGFHTTTQDQGMWDMPIDELSPQFAFTFDAEGTFNFHCIPHQISAMVGVVVVSPATVGVVTPIPRTLGFASPPAPNPTGTGVTFRFTTVAGRVKAEVFDARGRRVASIAERDFAAGSHALAWDGRTTAGGLAPAGVYHVRLALPGFSDSRRIIVSR